MAQNAITVNYEQFKQANGYAELKWTSDEALKCCMGGKSGGKLFL